MKTTGIIGALALLLAAGSTQAQSPIPGNNIDDFGPFTYSNPTPSPDRPIVAIHASGIPGNNVDDFGPLLPEGYVAEEELGAAGIEPGADAKAAERAQERAALREAARERFLRETWTSP